MDIEQTVRRYIEGAASIPSYLEVPSRLPPSFAVVELVGETRRHRGAVRRAVLAVHCWGRSRKDAAAACDAVAEAVPSMDSICDVGAARVESAVRDRDESTGWRRYRLAVEVEYFG